MRKVALSIFAIGALAVCAKAFAAAPVSVPPGTIYGTVEVVLAAKTPTQLPTIQNQHSIEVCNNSPYTAQCTVGGWGDGGPMLYTDGGEVVAVAGHSLATGQCWAVYVPEFNPVWCYSTTAQVPATYTDGGGALVVTPIRQN
jgi:hypothetical protein